MHAWGWSALSSLTGEGRGAAHRVVANQSVACRSAKTASIGRSVVGGKRLLMRVMTCWMSPSGQDAPPVTRMRRGGGGGGGALCAERRTSNVEHPTSNVGGGNVEGGALVLVVSHVINELSVEDRERLLALAASAAVVLWVEPGTHADSRALAEARDVLLVNAPAGAGAMGWRVVAPCTHRERCPLFEAANERHWCHFFAQPPTGIQNDSGWVRFGQRAGIDLRSLPYSFLVMERRADASEAPVCLNRIDVQNRDATRVLGRPEIFKGYARLLGCDGAGLRELELQKRADPVFFKNLERRPGVPLFRWRRIDGKRIVEVERVLSQGDDPQRDS